MEWNVSSGKLHIWCCCYQVTSVGKCPYITFCLCSLCLCHSLSESSTLFHSYTKENMCFMFVSLCKAFVLLSIPSFVFLFGLFHSLFGSLGIALCFSLLVEFSAMSYAFKCSSDLGRSLESYYWYGVGKLLFIKF